MENSEQDDLYSKSGKALSVPVCTVDLQSEASGGDSVRIHVSLAAQPPSASLGSLGGVPLESLLSVGLRIKTNSLFTGSCG